MKFAHKSLLLILLLLYFTTVFVFSTSKIVRADTVIFNDDFSDGFADGWTPITGASYLSVNDFRYGGTVTPSLTIADSVAGSTLWANYIYEVDMTAIQGADKNLLFRYLDSSHRYGFHISSGSIKLEKVHPTTVGHEDVVSAPITFDNNNTYHMKIVLLGSNIKIYQNDNLLIDYDDLSDPILFGKIGIRVGTGATAPSEVWFDNVVVTQLDSATPTPTPTIEPTPTPTLEPTPSPTPTPTPTPTLEPTIGPFDLPIDYTGRPANNSTQFKSGFWLKLNATFDHVFQTGYFTPFTGQFYFPTDCPSGTVGIKCYDSHNGVDFSRTGSLNVRSVGVGTVYYASAHTFSTCTPERGFGCVVIVGYPGNIFGLYAHLAQINVVEGQPVDENTLLGTMGATGCPGCGVHLHFGVLKPVGSFMFASPFMTKKDWQGLLSNIKADNSKGYRPSCTYRSPNNISFSFVDPSGWKGGGNDPWGLAKSQGGCGINSPYLWKFDVGVTP